MAGVLPRRRKSACSAVALRLTTVSDWERSCVQPIREALLPAEQRGKPGARATLFGMTEAFGPYCGYPADTDMPRSAWGSCGKPFPGMEVRITDPETGEPVPAGTIGMIELRGPHTLRGICRRSREDLFTTDGFYPTGDLGRLDNDGFLFYHGRSDDMFKVSGATVYPTEVEQALRDIDGVESAFVTNVTNQLLKRGLIHKTQDPNDRRRVRLEISPEGWSKLAELAPVQRMVNDVQFDCLSADEFKQLSDMIDRLIDSSNRALRLQAYFAEQPGPAPRREKSPPNIQ